jgi:hypothetical protein
MENRRDKAAGKIFLILTSIFILVLIISLVSASDVIVWQGQYYTGTTFNIGTYNFNFTVYDALTGGNICYSNTTTLTTGNFGEWKTEQYTVNANCNNVSKDYFLNVNINGIDQTPRRRLIVWNSLRKDVDEITSGTLQADTQVIAPILQANTQIKAPVVNSTQIITSNLTTINYGFFSFLGSLSSRINALFVKDISFNGSINGTGNVSANYFIGDGSLLTNLSAAGRNPFNQNLNTTSNVSFNQLNVANISLGSADRHLSSSGPGDLELSMTTPASTLNIKSGSGSDGSEIRLTASNVYLTGWIGLYGSSELWGSSNVYSTAKNAFVVSDDISYDPILSVDTINQAVFAKSLTVENDITTKAKIQGNYYSSDGSEGITDTTHYWACMGKDCRETCSLQIINGLITGCKEP